MTNAAEVAVLDLGSFFIKSGVPHELHFKPPTVTPSIVVNKETGDASRPIEYGNIQQWESLETLVDIVLYKELAWQAGNEGSVLLAEPLFTSRVDRERLTQLLFEHNNVSGLLICDAAVLSLYAMGKLSGCVLDLGHDKTDIAAVVDGQLLSPTAHRQLRDPEEVNQSLQSALKHNLKEGGAGQSCMLPDGQEIRLVPSKLSAGGKGMEAGKIETNWESSISSRLKEACLSIQDLGMRKVATENLLVCGGGSKTEGVTQRMIREFNACLSPSSTALLHAPDHMPASVAEFSAWMGGVVLAKAVSHPDQYMSKYEYNEAGPHAIHRHCT